MCGNCMKPTEWEHEQAKSITPIDHKVFFHTSKRKISLEQLDEIFDLLEETHDLFIGEGRSAR